VVCKYNYFVLILANEKSMHFSNPKPVCIFAHGEMAERFNAAVLKTVDGDEPSGGSNPSLSAWRFSQLHENQRKSP
jgi:hypothetical protein